MLMEVNSGCFIFLMNDDDHEDEWECYFMHLIWCFHEDIMKWCLMFVFLAMIQFGGCVMRLCYCLKKVGPNTTCWWKKKGCHRTPRKFHGSGSGTPQKINLKLPKKIGALKYCFSFPARVMFRFQLFVFGSFVLTIHKWRGSRIWFWRTLKIVRFIQPPLHLRTREMNRLLLRGTEIRNLKITPLKWNMFFQTFISLFHVNFQILGVWRCVKGTLEDYG